MTKALPSWTSTGNCSVGDRCHSPRQPGSAQRRPLAERASCQPFRNKIPSADAEDAILDFACAAHDRLRDAAAGAAWAFQSSHLARALAYLTRCLVGRAIGGRRTQFPSASGGAAVRASRTFQASPLARTLSCLVQRLVHQASAVPR
jgi:hypothetical protein